MEDVSEEGSQPSLKLESTIKLEAIDIVENDPLDDLGQSSDIHWTWKKEHKSSHCKSQRKNYQQFYNKREGSYFCLSCDAKYESTHGMHYHLNNTVCGFGTGQSKPKKDYRELYRREQGKFVCNRCDQCYESIRGVHYHLSKLRCGGRVQERDHTGPDLEASKSDKQFSLPTAAPKPKTCYTQFYTKDEENLICNTCGSNYLSIHGMHYHLKSTSCGFGTNQPSKKKRNHKQFYTKVENCYYCNYCEFRIDYLQGIHRHLKLCSGLTSLAEESGNIYEDEKSAMDICVVEVEDSNITYLETDMNFIGHDQNI